MNIEDKKLIEEKIKDLESTIPELRAQASRALTEHFNDNKNPEKSKKKVEALNAVGETRRTINYLRNSIES